MMTKINRSRCEGAECLQHDNLLLLIGFEDRYYIRPQKLCTKVSVTVLVQSHRFHSILTLVFHSAHIYMSTLASYSCIPTMLTLAEVTEWRSWQISIIRRLMVKFSEAHTYMYGACSCRYLAYVGLWTLGDKHQSSHSGLGFSFSGS